MTLKDLKIIYDRENIQAGDTDLDFYEWALAYLLNKTTYNKIQLEELKKEINRHLVGIKKAVEKLRE